MSVFLTRAADDGICNVPSLYSAIVLQLHKSGFLDQLPSLLRAAADQLARVSLQDNPEQLQGTMAAAGSRLQPAAAGGNSAQAEMQLYVECLLLSVQRIPGYMLELPSPRAITDTPQTPNAAALQLAVAGLQHFSRCVDLLQPDAALSLNTTKVLWQLTCKPSWS